MGDFALDYARAVEHLLPRHDDPFVDESIRTYLDRGLISDTPTVESKTISGFAMSLIRCRWVERDGWSEHRVLAACALSAAARGLTEIALGDAARALVYADLVTLPPEQELYESLYQQKKTWLERHCVAANIAMQMAFEYARKDDDGA